VLQAHTMHCASPVPAVEMDGVLMSSYSMAKELPKYKASHPDVGHKEAFTAVRRLSMFRRYRHPISYSSPRLSPRPPLRPFVHYSIFFALRSTMRSTSLLLVHYHSGPYDPLHVPFPIALSVLYNPLPSPSAPPASTVSNTTQVASLWATSDDNPKKGQTKEAKAPKEKKEKAPKKAPAKKKAAKESEASASEEADDDEE
jgi:hypothetical protein